jgi:hypothetical protein
MNHMLNLSRRKVQTLSSAKLTKRGARMKSTVRVMQWWPGKESVRTATTSWRTDGASMERRDDQRPASLLPSMVMSESAESTVMVVMVVTSSETSLQRHAKTQSGHQTHARRSARTHTTAGSIHWTTLLHDHTRRWSTVHDGGRRRSAVHNGGRRRSLLIDHLLWRGSIHDCRLLLVHHRR